MLFEQEASNYGLSFDIQDYDVDLVDLPDDIAGRCWFRGRGYNRGFRIELDAPLWEESSAEDRELLMFHELGHCVLGQDHRAGSIMEPRLFSGYFDRRPFYVPELFLHGFDARRGIKLGDDRPYYVDCGDSK